MSKKEWNKNFLKYMNFIAEHENYNGLAYSKKNDGSVSWIATKKSTIGQQRIIWAEKKADELGIPNLPGVYAKVMYQIHPSKEKVCQICGETMSLKYIYPNKGMIKSIIKEFNYTPSIFEDMHDIYKVLVGIGIPEKKIKKLLIKKLELNKSSIDMTSEDIINMGEEKCRMGNKNTFGPGAMSNFPDRYDGFHTYNRCCRSREDMGRHDENMKSYTKDRRAYENWSDGNIHAANKFMGSHFFEDMTADHIGPISLGFVHDPVYLQPMSAGDNSAKRDRLSKEDIELLIQKEKDTKLSPISWFSEKIWHYYKEKHIHESLTSSEIATCRDTLKQNLNNFLETLWYIVDVTDEKGEEFLEEFLLKPKQKYFKYDYTFNQNGEILTKNKRNITDATQKEYNRYARVAFESLENYHAKDNRNIKGTISHGLKKELDKICIEINVNPSNENTFKLLESYVEKMQVELLESVK